MQDVESDLLDMVEHPVFVLEPDADGVPRYAAFNAYARNVLGRPLDEILGCTAAELYPGRLGEVAYTHHVTAMTSAKPLIYEILLPLDGVQRLLRTTLRPVCDDSGAVVRIIGSSTDISGGHGLREARTEMATLTSEMEDFINLAAHDLRTPMRNVSFIAEMLREDFEDLGDGKLDLINTLEDIGKNAMRLISDVLSHAQATSLANQTVHFDFAGLVEEISTVLDPMGNCVIRQADGIVEGDRTATQIILRNLMDNAIKHWTLCGTAAAPADQQALELTIDLAELEDGFFEVTITDNGQGFTDPALLFLDTGQLRVDSGFGLFGVRRLIHARGGTLTVSNRADTQGAVIAFTLPGRRVTEAPSAQKIA